MCICQLIPGEKKNEWEQALLDCGLYDTYHLNGYHILAEEMNEGIPYLFLLKEGNNYAALPFLLRQINEIEGFESHIYKDATSVYGYPGVLTNVCHNDKSSLDFKKKFQMELLRCLRENEVISFFCRFNPLIPTSWLLEDIAQIITLNDTVAINLSQSEQEILKGMTKGHRYDIRKSRKQGVVVKEDILFNHLGEFVKIYNENMLNVGASQYYFFPNDYYIRCKELLKNSIKLYIAEKDGVIISAAMFFVSNDIIQYHLSGTDKKYLNYSGAKVILDEVRIWGKKQGFSWLHLGGGVGSKEDSLFRFKAGFSKFRFPFKIMKMIVNPAIYRELVEERTDWENRNGYIKKSEDYFPKYRTPIQKAVKYYD